LKTTSVCERTVDLAYKPSSFKLF